MRFVSKSANFSAGNLRNAKEAIGQPVTQVIGGRTVTAQAEAYTIIEAVPIQFSQAGLLQSDIDAAISHWKRFEGLPVEEDEVTPANPVENGRIGVWDSVECQNKYELTDEERERAENLLLNSPYYGTDFIVVEQAKAQKPWPTYDKTHHSKILTYATDLGLISEALAYEKENGNRPSVIEALEAAVTAEAGEIVPA